MQQTLTIAALQDAYSFPKNFKAYQDKVTKIVSSHAQKGVDLLLFPEYAGLEMVSFVPEEKIQDFLPSYLELFQDLSRQYKIWICSGTQIVKEQGRFFNRAYLFSPNDPPKYQDKCILTPEEEREDILSRGHSLKVFNTPWGTIGICICYDVEFPVLVQKLTAQGAKILLVPSYTSSMHGFYRVFLSARARALENQCYVVQSALVGQTDVEMAYGASAFLGPVDLGFPEDGILKMGTVNQMESVINTLNLEAIERVRREGKTHNFDDQKKVT